MRNLLVDLESANTVRMHSPSPTAADLSVFSRLLDGCASTGEAAAPRITPPRDAEGFNLKADVSPLDVRTKDSPNKQRQDPFTIWLM